MHAIADTDRLVSDGIISPEQASEIEARSRQAMVMLGINSVLSFGIIAATLGFILWLANATAVAVFGTLMLALGAAILRSGRDLLRMFGNASALIGAGMLIGGAAFELLDSYETVAGPIMALGGAGLTVVFALAHMRARNASGFVTGSMLLMAFAFHITGLGLWLEQLGQAGAVKSLFYLYTAAAMAGLGWLIDVRLVTALAIAPFAQALDTGTAYFHAAYVFYSPESTLSIIQMVALMIVCLLIAQHWPERTARHGRVLAVLAFIVANLCALVGSLWGDVVGDTIWGPQARDFTGEDQWDRLREAREAFEASTLVISDTAYAVFWAVALAAMIAYSAHRANRGLFNTALTFAAIHAYTQLFESFADEPLAYVIGGLAAIPLAWGMWRLDSWITAQRDQ